MPRLSAIAPALSVPVHCHYVTVPQSVPDPAEVAAALDRIAYRWDRYGILRYIRQVDLYYPSHPDAPVQIQAGAGGLYWPAERRITLNSEADWEACLAHECGHHVAILLQEHIASAFGDAFGEDARSAPACYREFFDAMAAKAGY